MKHVRIYKDSNHYSSFPHILKLANDDLLITFRRASKFSADAAVRGVATHHDPDSEIMVMRSSDHGHTWPEESLSVAYKSKFGVNDPSLTLLRDGSIINRFVALNIQPTQLVVEAPKKIFSHRSEHGLVTEVVGNLIIHSVDNGVSWNLIETKDFSSIGPSCSRDPILELADGSWLMPVYTGAPQRSDISWVIRSFDRGLIWTAPTRIMFDERGKHSQLQGINYNETSLIDLGKGELMALVRADAVFHTEGEFMPVGGVGGLSLSRSYDSGLSWSPPIETKIWGQPGSLIKLMDGRLLATYGYRKAPFGIRACFSGDNGKTWNLDNELIIRDDCPTWDCGYPFTIELERGKLLTVYYFVDELGVRFIAATHWDC